MLLLLLSLAQLVLLQVASFGVCLRFIDLSELGPDLYECLSYTVFIPLDRLSSFFKNIPSFKRNYSLFYNFNSYLV